jgi:hypothetical protein
MQSCDDCPSGQAADYAVCEACMTGGEMPFVSTKEVACSDCGKLYVRSSNVQKRCAECANKRKADKENGKRDKLTHESREILRKLPVAAEKPVQRPDEVHGFRCGNPDCPYREMFLKAFEARLIRFEL